jgi:AcrR family transcriptional regulator
MKCTGEMDMTKKQLIMEKAAELFAKQGFEATSVQQITDYCDISKGAFYLSFKSKDELVITLIDQFMRHFISDIDHIVNYSEDEDVILFEFYYKTYHYFQKHSDFAKIFIKEQMQSFNEDLILKFRDYNDIMEQIIFSMIERIYGDHVSDTKFDLMYCIKAFMSIFGELFIYYNTPVDLNLLCQSLVEKTNILAKYTNVPFITEGMVLCQQPLHEEITSEHLIEIIEKILDEINELIEKESLILLKEQLMEPSFSRAIIKGLIENIRHHSHCKWISYLLLHYFKF